MAAMEMTQNNSFDSVACVVCWLWIEQVLVQQMFKVMSFCLILGR